MNFSETVFKSDERAMYDLRKLYKQYGYSLYKVSKFEEYDLYAHNKSFLVSQNVLTFTDTNGKLLALKPDVTLSIIKNIPDHTTVTHKLCYNETVYRTAADSDGFREIMQTGLECIGSIDLYAECEVIMLAMQSLAIISQDYILDLSHMGLIEGLLEEAGVDTPNRDEFIRLIESKNVHALSLLCQKQKMESSIQTKLCELTELYLPIGKALPVLKSIVIGKKMQQAYDTLESIYTVLSACGFDKKLYLDFSIVNDVKYYDGLCFKGFINGIPDSVLSGGRYDRLLNRLGKKSGAIGFAVYLDRLERFESDASPYDVDTVLLYEAEADVQKVLAAQASLRQDGKRVITVSQLDPSIRYRMLAKLTDGGVKILETND